MPPVIGAIATVIASAAGAVGAGTTAALAIGVAGANVLVAVGSSLALGAVSRALQRKQSIPNLATSVLHNGQSRLVTVRQPAAPRRVLYGSVRTGGVFTFLQGAPLGGDTSSYVLMVMDIAGHAIESIDKVYLDGHELELSGTGEGIPTDPVYAEHLYFEKQLGLSGQTVFPSLPFDSGGVVDSNFRGHGNARMYIRLKYDPDLFPRGLPNFTFDVRGKLVFDPRSNSVKTISGATNASPIVITSTSHGFATGDKILVRDVNGNRGARGTWQITVLTADTFSLDGSSGTGTYTAGTGKCYKVEYSDDAALCTNDFLTDPMYGYKARYDEDIDLTRLAAAANVCDEDVVIAETGALSLDVDATAGTFTRATGSFIDDLFKAGMTITTSGFTNAGNNASFEIAEVAATVITVVDKTGMVTETGGGNEELEATEKRYTVNGLFDTTEKRGQVLQQLQNAMAGWVFPVAGKFATIPGAYRLPGIELSEDDFVEPLKIRTRQSRRDLFNGVKGTFMSPDHQWQTTDFPKVQDATFLSEDDGVEYWKDISLPFTTSPFRCQRIALIDLERQRRQIEINAAAKMRAYKAQSGDTVEVTLDRLSWNQEVFEVLQMLLSFRDDENGNRAQAIVARLRQTDFEVYDFAVDDYGNLIPEDALPGRQPLAAPPNWGLTANLGGDLRLSFAIPVDTDYRSGYLNMLVDDEPNRVSTKLAAAVIVGDDQIQVTGTEGFFVGDFINIGEEVMFISGPGEPGDPLDDSPSENTWDVVRAAALSTEGAHAYLDVIYRLTPKVLPFTLPRNWALEHPTLDLSSGEYYIQIFREGRFRILYGHLVMSDGQRISDYRDAEASFAFYGYEPNVFGTLPGLRSAVGGLLTLHIDGPLEVGVDTANMLAFPDGVTIGPTFATVPVGDEPAGNNVQFRINTMSADGTLLFHGGITGIADGNAGSGTFSSGAAGGKMDDLKWQLEILQVGSTSPGKNLTVYVPY